MFPIAITYIIWIPLEIFFYTIVGYFSKRNNEAGGKKFLVIMIALNLIPLWAFVAPDSKNLAFDMLLYDTLMTVVLTVTLLLLSKTQKLKSGSYAGIFLVIAGLILMRVKI